MDVTFSTLKEVFSFSHACGTKKRGRKALLKGVPEHGHGRAQPQEMFPSGKALDSTQKFLCDIKIPALWLVRLPDLGTRLSYLAHKSVTRHVFSFLKRNHKRNLLIPIPLTERSWERQFLPFYKEWVKIPYQIFVSMLCQASRYFHFRDFFKW